MVTNCWLLFLYFITEPHLRKLFSIDLQNRFPFIQKIFERLVKNIPFSIERDGTVYFPLREMIMYIFELTFATNWADCPLFKAIGGGFESSWDSECSPTAFQQWAMSTPSPPKSSQKGRNPLRSAGRASFPGFNLPPISFLTLPLFASICLLGPFHAVLSLEMIWHDGT